MRRITQRGRNRSTRMQGRRDENIRRRDASTQPGESAGAVRIGEVRLLGFVHHRLRLLAFPIRTGGAPPVKPKISQVFNEADKPSQLFQYYLLDTEGFEPNVFTKIFPGINDAVQLTATGGNCGLPTVGSVRVVLEPKPGLPTDPHHPKAFIDVFTDISPLFVINNESGWYEGWMIHDLVVPGTAPPRRDGHAAGKSIPEEGPSKVFEGGGSDRYEAETAITRVQALNDDLRTNFDRWYPDLRRRYEETLAA